MRRISQYWRHPLTALAALIALNILFHLPPLLNAAGVHSDAAIVGLQAMHLLRGEVDRFLWGAGYQSSFDAMVIAAFFAVTGPTALSLMMAPFLGHLLVGACAYGILYRNLRAPWLTAWLCLPLVFTPQAINGVALYAPRQWCVTTVFVGMWIFEGGTRLRPLRFFLGAFVIWLATFLDLFALQMTVPLTVLLLLCAFDAPRDKWQIAARLLLGTAGVGLGLLTVRWLRQAPESAAGALTVSITLEQMKHNWPLFWETCLPWVLGAKVWFHANGTTGFWSAPRWLKALQLVGACSLFLAISAAPLLIFRRKLTWPLKRLGLVAAGAAFASMGGFLVSYMPADMWSARYLAPVIWFSPFALAPWAKTFRPQVLALLMLPYLATGALGGWKAYGSYVEGAWPRRDARGVAAQEMKLQAELKRRGVEVGFAQFWLSYRLTFLWREQPIVRPVNSDRYEGYATQTAAARTVAFIFHPSAPYLVPEQIIPTLPPGSFERLEIEGFTVLLQHR